MKILASIGNMISYAWEEFSRVIKEYYIAAWAVVLAVLTAISYGLSILIKVINILIPLLQGIDVASFDFSVPSPIANVLALMNTFFPLDELVRYFVSFCLFSITWSAYKFIKSWLPRINGWGFGG